jgi:hypothetical protein
MTELSDYQRMVERPHLAAKDRTISNLRAEIDRLRAREREAFRAGFHEWWGCTNEAEEQAFDAMEASAWQQYMQHVEQQAPQS